jgi:YtxH-like protein
MARVEARSADELTAAIRSLVDRAMESEARDRVASRGREVAAALMNAGELARERAGEAWQESEPARLEATRTARRAGRKAWSWGLRAWDRRVRPTLREQLRRRGTAIAAASLTVPTSEELIRTARQRLGLERREVHRWRYFAVGVLIGAIAGAIAALLTAPRPGREVRNELGARAREAATTAREAAGTAGEWAPLFQRASMEDTDVQLAADGGTGADGEPADEAAEAIEESEAH